MWEFVLFDFSVYTFYTQLENRKLHSNHAVRQSVSTTSLKLTTEWHARTLSQIIYLMMTLHTSCFVFFHMNGFGVSCLLSRGGAGVSLSEFCCFQVYFTSVPNCFISVLLVLQVLSFSTGFCSFIHSVLLKHHLILPTNVIFAYYIQL